MQERETLKSVLWTAAREGDLSVVQRVSPYFSDSAEELGEALSWACDRGQWDVGRWLAQHTALQDDVGELSWALRMACDRGQWDVVR